MPCLIYTTVLAMSSAMYRPLFLFSLTRSGCTGHVKFYSWTAPAGLERVYVHGAKVS